jgi:hypothetical protein
MGQCGVIAINTIHYPGKGFSGFPELKKGVFCGVHKKAGGKKRS